MARSARSGGASLLAFALIALTVLLGSPSPAFAGHGGTVWTDPHNGNRAYCNVHVWDSNSSPITHYNEGYGVGVGCQLSTTVYNETDTKIRIASYYRSGGSNFSTSHLLDLSCSHAGMSCTPQSIVGNRPLVGFCSVGAPCDGQEIAAFSTCEVYVGAVGPWQCSVLGTSVAAGSPSIPLDHFEGGSPGPLTIDPPEGECIVVRKAVGEGIWLAVLHVDVTNAQANTTDEGEVVWESGGTPEAIELETDVEHEYGAPTAGAPFEVTITVTRTQNGLETNSAEESCELVVDFFNSANPTAPLGGGPGEEVEPGVEESCALFDLPCWLRKIFIPDTEEWADSWDSLYEEMETHWPYAPIDWAADSMNVESANLARFDDSFDGYAEIEELPFPGLGIEGCPDGEVTGLPTPSESRVRIAFTVGGHNFGFVAIDNCEQPAGAIEMLQRTTWWGSTIIILGAVVAMVVRVVNNGTGATSE